MFNCPRSNYLNNVCRDCSRIYSEFKPDDDDFFLLKSYFDSDETYEKQEYILNFKMKIFYDNIEQKNVLESNLKRCLTLKIFRSSFDIYICFLEVLSRILFHSFYSITDENFFDKDCETYISLFHEFYKDFMIEINKNLKKNLFKKIFLEFEINKDYNSNFIRILNQKYIDVIKNKKCSDKKLYN